MNIPDESVEAAAMVLCEQWWENAHESQRAYARNEARAALEAAAPHLEAEQAIGAADGLRSIPVGALVMSSTRFFKTPKIYQRVPSGFVDIEKGAKHGIYAIGYFKDPLPVTVIWTPEERP